MADNEIRMEELSVAAEAESSNPPESVLKNLVDNRSAVENEILRLLASSKKDFKKLLNQWIASRLRNDDYQAYACTAEWEAISREGESNIATNNFIEILDILESEENLIVDLEFKSQFHIPNASDMYKSVQRCLPLAFVGDDKKLEKIINLIASVAADSMAAQDIPPIISPQKMCLRWLPENVVTRR